MCYLSEEPHDELVTNAHFQNRELVFPMIPLVLEADLMMLCSRAISIDYSYCFKASFSLDHEITLRETCVQFWHVALKVL